MFYASLKWVPVRAQDLGEFFAPNPWNGSPREKWTINVYILTSESFATTARWNLIRKEQKSKDDLATRRQKVQSKKLGYGKTIGIESPDGRIHMLPRVLIDLWQAREVQDEQLPTLIKDFEPHIKRSDFRMKRLRTIFVLESYVFLGLSILALAGFLIMQAISYSPSPHRQIRPTQAEWLSRPMTEHAIWAQGSGLPADRCFHLRPGLIHTPAGLTTYGNLDLLCSFKAQSETRLVLMEAYGGGARPSSIILRGVVLPPAQLGLPPDLMSALAQRVPQLNTNYLLVYNVDWAGQTNSADFDEIKPILGGAAIVCAIPFLIYLIASRFWSKRDRQLKEQFRAALGRSYADRPIQPAMQI